MQLLEHEDFCVLRLMCRGTKCCWLKSHRAHDNQLGNIIKDRTKQRGQRLALQLTSNSLSRWILGVK